MLDDAVHAVLAAYPTIHGACRRRPQYIRWRGGRLSNHLVSVLDQLDPGEPLTVGELASRMRVTPATISLQVGLLVRLRLVIRSRSAEDARRVELRLSDAGLRIREQHSLLDPTRVRAALARLPDPERAAVVTGVQLLARAARELPRAAPASSPEREHP